MQGEPGATACWHSVGAACGHGQLRVVKRDSGFDSREASDARDLLRRIGPARATPCDELDRVDSAVADLRAMDHRVVHPKQRRQVALRESGALAQLPEPDAHPPIRGAVL